MAHTAMARGPLMPRLTTDSVMAHMAMARGLPMRRLTTEDSATDPMDMASVLLTPRLTTDSDTDLTVMESAPLTPRLTTDLDTDPTATESAPLTPKLTTEDSVTDPTDMASALPMLRPSLRLLPTTDGAGMAHTAMESALLMLRPTTEDSATDPTATASALLTPRLTTDLDTDLMVMARGQPMLTTDTASKRFTTDGQAQPKLKIIAKRKSKSGTKPKLHPGTKSDPRTDMIREFCNLLHETKINIC